MSLWLAEFVCNRNFRSNLPVIHAGLTLMHIWEDIQPLHAGDKIKFHTQGVEELPVPIRIRILDHRSAPRTPD